MSKYDDIINLPRFEPKRHRRMSMDNRAAQFAPFAALTGHDSAIEETARLTEKMIEVSPEEQQEMSGKLLKAFDQQLPVTITYFVPDPAKAGGKYISATGTIKKIDEIESTLTLHKGPSIPLPHICAVTLSHGL